MPKVRYIGSPQVSARIIPLKDLGEDSDEILVFNHQNDFTQEVSESQLAALKRMAGGFKDLNEREMDALEPSEDLSPTGIAEALVEEEKANDEQVDQAIDDHASDPNVPSSVPKRPSKKGTRPRA